MQNYGMLYRRYKQHYKLQMLHAVEDLKVEISGLVLSVAKK